jgi:hypothetical protein
VNVRTAVVASAIATMAVVIGPINAYRIIKPTHTAIKEKITIKASKAKFIDFEIILLSFRLVV